MIAPWTHAELSRMLALTRQGLSAGQIAARLNHEFDTGRSRNAVIGKLMRGNGQFGRLQREPGYAPPPATRTPPREPKAKPVCRPPVPAVALAVPAPLQAPAARPVNLPAPVPMPFLEAMFADRCLHFVGDPLGPGGPAMPVCGAERAQSAPVHNRYCARHLAGVARPREVAA